MRVLTLGGGTVGTWIADLLCRYRHDVTVVDTDAENVRRINHDLDVRAIQGSASQSSVLFQAGVMGCDVCLAVTGQDEVNMVAASMAKAMGVRRSVARVYTPVFRDLSTFDYQRHFGIDRLLSLEHLTAMELARAIRNPESLTLEHFARGQLEVADFEVTRLSDSLNKPLKQLAMSQHVRLGTIRRDKKTWIARAHDEIHLGDWVSLIGRPDELQEFKKTFSLGRPKRQFIVIAGGGETGYHLAKALDAQRHKVLLLESDSERCDYLATHLDRTTVVHADATRKLTLEEERVSGCDYFVACTGNDENNIMSGIEAKSLGAQQIMAIVGRPDYAEIVGRLGIDIAVSERDAMARQILGLMTEGPVLSQLQLPASNIFVLELEVLEGAQVSESNLAEVPFPEGVLVAAVLQEDYVRVPTAADSLQVGNTALVLAPAACVDQVVQAFK
ncbi:Trk system potassium transporter TrkA [Aureliella helgolandensis]|uniref:Trk system potassium uptake protein TrkA n=1 Tax=Aureliella helgolandensis TaxID=2527968 RepID=A0A518G0E0_9BACT|nr:Trk system potassium transporter TrkA [Aureliella helgolandensis]QDV22065.1 Trk system potassium uptake protein TrkA [Aureliella helgolandensis]